MTLQSERGIYFLPVAQCCVSSTLHVICKVRDSDHRTTTDDTATGKWETQQYLREKVSALCLIHTCRKMVAIFKKHFFSVFKKVDVPLSQKKDKVLPSTL